MDSSVYACICVYMRINIPPILLLLSTLTLTTLSLYPYHLLYPYSYHSTALPLPERKHHEWA